MKKRIVALALALCMVVGGMGQAVTTYATDAEQVESTEVVETETAEEAENVETEEVVALADAEEPYDVITPADYARSGKAYPVVYVLPQNGYDKDDSGITEKLQTAMEDGVAMDMIIVKPAFEEGMDVREVMDAIVAEVDEAYRTIALPEYRTLIGTGVGGYLAYIIGMTEPVQTDVAPAVVDLTPDDLLTEPKTFYAMASIRGDLVSQDNPWYYTYGDVSKYLQENRANVGNFYTYLDAPVTDKWTNMDRSSNDIGQLFDGMDLLPTQNEFTVRTGSFTDAFLTESVNRVADRVTQGMLTRMVSGSVVADKTMVTDADLSVKATYTVNATDAIANIAKETMSVNVVVSFVDPGTGKTLTAKSVEQVIKAGETVTGEVTLDGAFEDLSANLTLEVQILGAAIELSSVSVVHVNDTVVDGDFQYIDLMGNWHFKYIGGKTGMAVEDVLAEYKSWSVVRPALSGWVKGFGNIDDTTVPLPPYLQSWFDYMIIGDGYYAREFEVPAGFDLDEYLLSIGNLDDRGQVFINGELIGETGMVNGVYNGESAWEDYSLFTIDGDKLKKGTNTIVVRCQNDGTGGGGWFKGPVGIYSTSAHEELVGMTEFTEYTFESKYAAEGLESEEETVENKYLVYLPKDYYETDRYYPTVYLMHQYNSTHKSYRTDEVDKLITKGVEDGLFDDMIIVVPNSDEESWWTPVWQKMITEELIPIIDSTYRTIDDARYRFTAGCSMGGQGAMAVALGNPNYFSGAISFFGALSMPNGGIDVLEAAQKESVDFLNYYSLYFVCGNQDIYSFGDPAIELNQILEEKGIEHFFFIENGEHNSAFYLPYFQQAFEYTRNQMYKSDDAVEALLSGVVSVADGIAKVAFEAKEGIETYYNIVPASTYTKETNPELNVPLIIEVVQDGEVVYSQTIRDNSVITGNTSEIYDIDLTDCVDVSKDYEVVVKAAIFDRVVELDSEVVKASEDQPADPEQKPADPEQKPADTTKPGTSGDVATGDSTPIVMFVGIAVVAMAAVVVVLQKRRRA